MKHTKTKISLKRKFGEESTKADEGESKQRGVESNQKSTKRKGGEDSTKAGESETKPKSKPGGKSVIPPESASLCQYAPNSVLQRRIAMRRFKCQCGKIFPRLEDLQKHVCIDDDNPYKCEQCGMLFTDEDVLIYHVGQTHKKIT